MLNKFCNKQLSRAISVLLSLCLMLTGAIVMGTIASAEENIITNGGFETGDHTGWNNGANAEIVSNEHHSGSHSLRLVCRNWASYSQSFSVIPEAKYRISWYMKSSDPGVGLTVKVLLPSDATHIQKWKNGGTDWELCEIEFTAPKNTTELKLLFTEDSDVVRYLDDIVVKQLKESTFDGFIRNGGFETGDCTDWTNWTDSAVTSEDKRSGAYSLHFNSVGWSAFFQNFNVTPGRDYRVTLYYKNANSNTANFGVYIKYPSGDGDATHFENWYGGESASLWQKVTFDFKAPEGITEMKLVLTANGQSEKYIDDISIRELKEPSYDGYLYNGDFETGEHGAWQNGAGSNASIVDTEAHGGNYCLRLKSKGWNAYGQEFTVTPGTKYKLSFYMKAETTGKSLPIYIKNYAVNPENNKPYDTNINEKWFNDTSEWKRNVLEFETPEGCDKVRLHISGDSDTIRYLDDFKVEIAVPMSDDGYIKNGTFEIGEDTEWTNWNASVVTAEAAYSGSFGLKLAGGDWSEFSQVFGVEPGYTYTVSYWLKATETAGTAKLYVKDGTADFELAQADINGSTEEWQKQTVKFTAAPSTTRAKLIFYAQGSVKYIDDISVTGPVSYLKNAGFEKGNADGWENGANLSVTEEAAHSGKYSLKYMSSGWSAFFQDFTVAPNTDYRLSLWIKNINNVDIGIYIKKVVGGGDEDFVDNWVSAEGDGWERITINFTSPADADKMRLSLTADGLSEKYIDDIEIVRIGDTNADGELNANDIAALRKYLIGADNSGVNEFRGDINNDGTANIIDLIALKKRLA